MRAQIGLWKPSSDAGDREALCKELGIRYIHLRIFSAYGPGDHPWTLVESCLDAFTGNAALSLGACTQKWNFIYITDLAKAVRALFGDAGSGLLRDSEIRSLTWPGTIPGH